MSVPFLTLPFENKSGSSHGALMPLLNINVKALIVFGALMAISAFIVPLFVNNSPAMSAAGPSPEMTTTEDFNKYYNHNHWGKEHRSNY